jgi:quinoprotein glucose dehydrogenase
MIRTTRGTSATALAIFGWLAVVARVSTWSALPTSALEISGEISASAGVQQTTPPAASAPQVSVLDGVYTTDQAKRGATAYGDNCARCHGNALEGNTENATPLTGSEFTSRWGRSTVGALFNRIRTSMPDDDPGTVSAEDTADVIAYMLSVNKYPAGKTELPHDSEALKKIQFAPIKSGIASNPSQSPSKYPSK